MAIPDIDIPSYVLTIEQEGGERRTHAYQQLSALGLNTSFVKGFDKEDPSIIDEYNGLLNLLLSKRSLTNGEVAVYCGHRKIWRKFLASHHTHALILEDDFRINDKDKFLRAICDGFDHSLDWDILKFFDFKPKRVLERKAINETSIVRYKYAASGAVAYLIDREAAEKLLSRKRFFRAVDEDLSWPWELGLSVWSVSPNLVEEVSHTLGGSLLEADRMSKKRRRNVFRSLWGNVIQAYKLVRSKTYNARFG
ncbi:MAG: glycosyltransferase family 25 protein [Nitratireductor sp.]|uniref:glycosyltransferase family 25 protein n=1 Tax=Nitratireductor sp. TaxID=1872084 RepID=UPI002612CD9E|nr:glycosyltransferase family 25 protein [Nitratireductor sp.]MCV0352547.1 glycosyltransferase family 25 protein [Nitratireductor sp.]